MYRFCYKKYNYFVLSATNVRNRQQPELLQDSRLKAAGGKTRNIAYSPRFAAMLQNKLHGFLLPVIPYLKR